MIMKDPQSDTREDKMRGAKIRGWKFQTSEKYFEVF
jgi:hypothetical protein